MADQVAEPVKQTPSFQGATLDKVQFIRKGEEVITPKEEPVTEPVVEPKVEAPKTEAPKVDGIVNTGEPKVEAPKTEAIAGEGTQEPGEYTEEDFHSDVNSYLETATSGAVKSPEDINKLIADNKDLKVKLQHKEPDFPSEQAKKVYDLAVMASGMEVDKARQLFHVISLDLSTMTPKEKQFEAFCLERPKVSREEARKRFEAVYDKKFSDLENDVVQLDDHEIATHDAENKIKELQKSLSEPVKQGGKQAEQGQQQQFTAAQEAEIETRLQSSLEGFAGVRFKFDDSKYGALEVPMDQGKAKEFMEFMKNPQLAIQNRIAERSKDANGNFNYDAYVREAFTWFFRDNIDQLTQNHLINLGKLSKIQEQKNTPKKDLTETQTTPVQKTFKQTMIEAVKGAGLVN